MLLNGIVCLKQLQNELPVLLAFNLHQVGALFHLNYLFSLIVEGCLAVLKSLFQLPFFFLPLLELPLNLVHKVMSDSDLI